MPLQSIKQSTAMHHGRRLKVLLLEHCVLMIDVCSTQTSLSGAGFGLQAQKLYLFLHSDIKRASSEYTAAEATGW